ncbi:hypothetical protein N2152v2_001983 [Parachlorella kessleri]
MEQINKLRIELADEVASLPSALHSEFPDLAVDWLSTVFPEGHSSTVRRLDAASQPKLDAVGQPQGMALSEQQLAEFTARLSALALEAQRLEATAAPSLSSYAGLMVAPASDAVAMTQQRKHLAGKPPQQEHQRQRQEQRLPLMRCRRCSRVLLQPAAAQHASHCQPRPTSRAAAAAAVPQARVSLQQQEQRARGLPDDSSSSEEDDEPIRRPNSRASRGTKGGSKRKRPSGAAAAAPAETGVKSKLPCGSGGVGGWGGQAAAAAAAAAPATDGGLGHAFDAGEPSFCFKGEGLGAAPLQLPDPLAVPAASLPPGQMVVCPPGSRRRRSAWPTRRRRQALTFCPGLDLSRPVQLEPTLPRLPGAGGVGPLSGGLPMASRMMMMPPPGSWMPPLSQGLPLAALHMAAAAAAAAAAANAAGSRPGPALGIPLPGTAGQGPAAMAAGAPGPGNPMLLPHQYLRPPLLPQPTLGGASRLPAQTQSPQQLWQQQQSLLQRPPGVALSATARPGMQLPPFFLPPSLGLASSMPLGQPGASPILMRQASPQHPGAPGQAVPSPQRPYAMVPQQATLSQPLAGAAAAAAAAAVAQRPGQLPVPMYPQQQQYPQQQPQSQLLAAPQPGVNGQAVAASAAAASPGLQRPMGLATVSQPYLLQQQQQLLLMGRGRGLVSTASAAPGSGAPGATAPLAGTLIASAQRPAGQPLSSAALGSFSAQKAQQLQMYFQQQQQLLQQPRPSMAASPGAALEPASRPAAVALHDIPPSAQLHQPFYLHTAGAPAARPAAKAAASGGRGRGKRPLGAAALSVSSPSPGDSSGSMPGAALVAQPSVLPAGGQARPAAAAVPAARHPGSSPPPQWPLPASQPMLPYAIPPGAGASPLQAQAPRPSGGPARPVLGLAAGYGAAGVGTLGPLAPPLGFPWPPHLPPASAGSPALGVPVPLGQRASPVPPAMPLQKFATSISAQPVNGMSGFGPGGGQGHGSGPVVHHMAPQEVPAVQQHQQ